MPYAWSTAATIEPWPEGKNFFPRIFADVEQAYSSVHILMFGWREGEIGTQVRRPARAEVEAGCRGANHRRRQGSRSSGPAGPMFTRLADAGAQIVVNDLSPVGRGRPLPRPSSVRLDSGRRRPRRPSQALRDRRNRHVDWWRRDRRPLCERQVPRRDGASNRERRAPGSGALSDELSRPRRSAATAISRSTSRSSREPGTVPIALLQVAPGGFQSATQAIRALIDHARTRLDIMNPYFTDADIIERVVAAAKRGVKVRIVVSEKSNNPQATAALKHHYGELLRAGVKIWEYPGAVVHAKLDGCRRHSRLRHREL